MLSSLLNSTNSEPAHASSPGSARLSSPGKQNSVPWSPRASRSPVKQSDASLDAHSHGKNAGASSASPSTPSRAALGNLIHATDQEPRATPTPNGDRATNDHHSSQSIGNDQGNSSNTLDDGDVTMDDAPDEDLVEQAMRDAADMSDEGEGEGEGDEEDDDDEDDDEDDEEDSEDEGDDSDSSVSFA